MDIVEAARHGWDRKTSISMNLVNLTPAEFREHVFLDRKLYGLSPYSIIYRTYPGKKISSLEDLQSMEDIGVRSGQDGRWEDYALVETAPRFHDSDGYGEFMLKAIEHLNARGSSFLDTVDWNYQYIKGPWNNAKKVGHEEIADLADFFHKEFVKIHAKGAKTRIATSYSKLNPQDILNMKYRPKNVLSFKVVNTDDNEE
jgi:hypothetical protein